MFTGGHDDFVDSQRLQSLDYLFHLALAQRLAAIGWQYAILTDHPDFWSGPGIWGL